MLLDKSSVSEALLGRLVPRERCCPVTCSSRWAAKKMRSRLDPVPVRSAGPRAMLTKVERFAISLVLSKATTPGVTIAWRQSREESRDAGARRDVGRCGFVCRGRARERGRPRGRRCDDEALGRNE